MRPRNTDQLFAHCTLQRRDFLLCNIRMVWISDWKLCTSEAPFTFAFPVFLCQHLGIAWFSHSPPLRWIARTPELKVPHGGPTGARIPWHIQRRCICGTTRRPYRCSKTRLAHRRDFPPGSVNHGRGSDTVARRPARCIGRPRLPSVDKYTLLRCPSVHERQSGRPGHHGKEVEHPVYHDE